jgi:ligand-binding sensor domain-containing protein/signal transduction histidine kinase
MLALAPYARSDAPLPLEPAFREVVWNKERGLPDNQVNALLQTRDGYLWIATPHGLGRFDGVRFVLFDRSNVRRMTSEYCRALAEDDQGDLWVLTKTDLLRCRRSSANGEIEAVLSGRTDLATLCAGRDGRVWIGTADGLFSCREGVLYHWEILPDASGARDPRPLYEDSSGVVWVANRGDLLALHPGDGNVELFDRADYPEVLRPEGSVHAIQGNAGGEVFALVCRPDSLGRLLRLEAGRWEAVSGFDSYHDESRFLARTRRGGLWMASGNAGVWEYRDGRFTRHPFSLAYADDHATCLLEDHEGNLWIGTAHSGLFWWQHSRVRTLGLADGLADLDTWAIYQTRDLAVWIGTDLGLSRHEGGVHTTFGTGNGLPHDNVRALTEDRAGRLWIGTSPGLSAFHRGRFQALPLSGDWPRSKIRALHADGNGLLWIGTAAGLRTVEIAPVSTNSPAELSIGSAERPLPDSAEVLARADIRALLGDRTGAIWVGTYAQGLYRLDQGRLEHFTPTNGLVGPTAWALCEDREGVIWAGTDLGLSRYERGRFTSITTREGMFDDPIHALVEDDAGNLWCSSDRGIWRVALEELRALAQGRSRSVRSIVYGELDGVRGNESNGQRCQPAAIKSADGKVWVASPRGAVVLDPRDLPDEIGQPRAVVEQLRANGRIVLGAEFGGSYDTHPLDGSAAIRSHQVDSPPLRLPPGSAHVIELTYTGNSFVSADRARFRYRLEGVDRDWVEAGTRRVAYYANLAPGGYRFHVAAANHHGLGRGAETTLAFYIVPHLYQTAGFKAAAAGLAVCLLVGLYVWRVGELRRIEQLRQQAALNQERARIAKDLHDGVGASLTQLAMLADLAEKGEAPAGSPATGRLSRMARELLNNLKDVLWSTDPGDPTLDGLMNRICLQAEETLSAAGMRARFQLPESLPALPLTAPVRHHLFLVAKEALTNIAKHSQGGEARLTATCEAGLLVLTIEDNGRGLNGAGGALPSSASAERAGGGSGRGLKNMRSRIEGLGGTLTLTSQPGQGTRLRIEVRVAPGSG